MTSEPAIDQPAQLLARRIAEHLQDARDRPTDTLATELAVLVLAELRHALRVAMASMLDPQSSDLAVLEQQRAQLLMRLSILDRRVADLRQLRPASGEHLQ